MSSSGAQTGLYIAYGALGLGAVVTIYCGSFSSLKTPKTTKKLRRARAVRSDAEEEEESEDEGDVSEVLTSSDAWLFPIFGSISLFGLYLLFKYLDKEYINKILSAYFAVVGVLALTETSVAFVRGAVGRNLWSKVAKWKVLLLKGPKEVFRAHFTAVHLILLVTSAILTVYYVITKNWMASNALALSLAFNAIGLMGLDSFRTGAILLGGLFVYDVFWVFGTDVMVSVAKSFDAPIKIVYPKDFNPPAGEKFAFTMLGLGDIVIPGIFVALALRFDQHQHSVRKPSISFTRHFTSFPKPYFTATMIAYIFGLATTMAVMHIFKAAQPALLYLSPACVSAVALTAFARGENKTAWGWTDAEDEASEDGSEKVKTVELRNSEKNIGSKQAPRETNATVSLTSDHDGVTKSNGLAAPVDAEAGSASEMEADGDGEGKKKPKKKKGKKK